LVLIKLVLNGQPIYYLSIFRLPKKVAKNINQMLRRFLWCGKKEGKFCALIKWEIIQQLKTKEDWGLVIALWKMKLCYLNGGGDMLVRKVLRGGK